MNTLTLEDLQNVRNCIIDVVPIISRTDGESPQTQVENGMRFKSFLYGLLKFEIVKTVTQLTAVDVILPMNSGVSTANTETGEYLSLMQAAIETLGQLREISEAAGSVEDSAHWATAIHWYEVAAAVAQEQSA